MYICGPTRTGKTTWARSLGQHNYYNSIIDFTTYNDAAQYNILDDVNFKYCPQWKQLIGCHSDYTVNPKYGRKKVIKGGIPCIVLCNEDEDWFSVMTPSQKDYLESNCVVFIMFPGTTFFVDC